MGCGLGYVQCREVDAISVGTCCGEGGAELTDRDLRSVLLMLEISILSSCVSMAHTIFAYVQGVTNIDIDA